MACGIHGHFCNEVCRDVRLYLGIAAVYITVCGFQHPDKVQPCPKVAEKETKARKVKDDQYDQCSVAHVRIVGNKGSHLSQYFGNFCDLCKAQPQYDFREPVAHLQKVVIAYVFALEPFGIGDHFGPRYAKQKADKVAEGKQSP